MNKLRLIVLLQSLIAAIVLTLVVSCQQEGEPKESSVNVKPTPSKAHLPEVPEDIRAAVSNEKILNREAVIPAQCYTKTESKHNPCYVCHQVYDRSGEDRLNRLDDGALQGSYEFSDVGVTNHWANLFKDKSAWLEQISDEQIQLYVNEDNYDALANRLEESNWQGFIPDLKNFGKAAAAFDDKGLALDGSYWVAFNYKPFPGTFWPTNGATDDVLIRLPKAFREINGEFNKDVYFINLSLVELSIKNLDKTSIWPVDEQVIGVDLDNNSTQNMATEVHRRVHYIGDASSTEIEFQQFPEGTQFMHSVRYLGVDKNDGIYVPKRMKELRYMQKMSVIERQDLNSRYDRERKEKLLAELPTFINRGDDGLDNGLGWFVLGFIEDYDGNLRPQSYEENFFCMGCHKAIGTTIDSTFSFARKVTGAQGWGYINLKSMKDAPSVSEPGGEIMQYLKRAGGGDEFRNNNEIVEKWFNADGSINEAAVAAADVYTLVTPSKRRALDLNKAYTHTVRHQSYIFGRDSTWMPLQNIFREIDQDVPPLDGQHQHYQWDIRLDWKQDKNNLLTN